MSDAHSADVVIVGSGMNSLSCAALLAVQGLAVTVLSSKTIRGVPPSFITSNTNRASPAPVRSPFLT